MVPPTGSKARAWSSIERSLSATAPPHTVSTSVRRSLWAASVVGAGVLLWMLGFQPTAPPSLSGTVSELSERALQTSATLARANGADDVVATAAGDGEAPSPSPFDESPEPHSSVSASPSPPRRSSSHKPSRPRSGKQVRSPIREESSFDAELALLKAAKADLNRGRLAAAQRRLEEHQERFASGVFRDERDALVVVIACRRADDSPDTRAQLRQSFLKRHPSSPFASRIRNACFVETPKDPASGG